MRWVRANIRVGSWTALFALAIQFTLLFGHFHRNELVLPRGTVAVSALAGSDAAGGPEGPGSPLTGAGIGFDSCAICVVINLLGTMMSAAAPATQLPLAFGWLQFSTPTDVVVTATPHLLFRARAPPLA